MQENAEVLQNTSFSISASNCSFRKTIDNDFMDLFIDSFMSEPN